MRFLVVITLVLAGYLTHAHPSYGMAFDTSGNLYFADISKNERGTVWKLTPKGELVTLFKDFHAHSLSVDTEDNLWVAHGEDTHFMLKISPEGAIDTIVFETDHDKFFGGNNGVLPDGKVLFGINKHIYQWSEKGRRLHSDLELSWNNMMYVDREGNAYVNDLNKNNGTVYKIDQGGDYLELANNLIEKPEDFDKHQHILLGIGTDSESNVFVADMGGRRIVKIDQGGLVSDFYKSDPPWLPTGITFAQQTAYILEFTSDLDGPRVVRVKESGEKEVYFDYAQYMEGSFKFPSSGMGNRGMPFLFSLFIALIMFTGVLVYAKYRIIFRRH